MQKDILINGVSFNIEHNASLSKEKFCEDHKHQFTSEAEAKKAHTIIKKAHGDAVTEE